MAPTINRPSSLLKSTVVWAGAAAVIFVGLRLTGLTPFEPISAKLQEEKFTSDQLALGLPVGGKYWGFVEWKFSDPKSFPSVVQASYGIQENKNTANISLNFLEPPYEKIILQEGSELFLRDVPVDYGHLLSGRRAYSIRFNGRDSYLWNIRFYRPEIPPPSLWRLTPLLLGIVLWGAVRGWRSWRGGILAAIVVVGAVMRWHVFQNYFSVPLEGDAPGYLDFARHILWANPFYMGREPGFPWILKAGLMLFGDSERTARFVSFLFSLACIPAAFFALRGFDYAEFACCIAAALVAINPFAIHMSVQGLQLEVFTFLILLLSIIWRNQKALHLGLCSGFLTILRLQSFFSVIPLALYAAWRRRWSLNKTAACFLGLAVFAGPYFLTVKMSTGQFFQHLNVHTSYYSAAEKFADPLHPVVKQSAWDYVLRDHSPLELLWKTLGGYGQIFFNPNNEFNQIYLNSHFRSRGNLILFPFFCIGILLCLRTPSGRELLVFPVLFLGVLPFLQSEFREWRLLFHVAPFVSMIAAVGLETALKGFKKTAFTKRFASEGS